MVFGKGGAGGAAVGEEFRVGRLGMEGVWMVVVVLDLVHGVGAVGEE